MSKRRVVICGLARDVSKDLRASIARIEQQGEMFADYRVVIYENDSIDDTLSILSSWESQNPRVTVLTETLGSPVNPMTRCLDRALRMARYRNIYREFVASEFPDFDYAMVVDTDLSGGWSLEGVCHTFGQEYWDFVGSYGVIYKRVRFKPNEIVHYDAWAFRPFGRYEPMTTREANRLAWDRGAPMVPVYSCFGGLGIYRMAALASCKYSGCDVEHVPLHREMRERGFSSQFLNPSQVTMYGRKRRSLDTLMLGAINLFQPGAVQFR